MPMGMASLLTAPLVADGTAEDSVSLNFALYNFKSLHHYKAKVCHVFPRNKQTLPALLMEVLIILSLLGMVS